MTTISMDERNDEYTSVMRIDWSVFKCGIGPENRMNTNTNTRLSVFCRTHALAHIPNSINSVVIYNLRFTENKILIYEL